MSDMNYMIPSRNFGELEFKIAKLNKRATKLNIPAIVLTVVATHEKEIRPEGGLPFTRRYFEVAIDGVAPKLAGWTFLGTLEHTDHGNILRSVPGSEIPESYRTAKRVCDHCATIRNRKDTYIVQSDDGSVKQVGHNCVADFLGHTDPNHIARMAQFLRDLQSAGGDEDSFGGFGGGGLRTEASAYFCAMVSAVIKIEGWMSATKAREQGFGETTSGTAWAHCFPTAQFMELLKRDGKKLIVPSDEDYALAKDAIEYARTMDTPDQYTGNLKIAALNEFVGARGTGLLASLVPFYQRKMAKEIEYKKRMSTMSESNYFGTVGKREIFELTVVGENTFDTQFGTTSLYRMRDNAGNVAVWFTSSGSLEVGKTYKIKGTVKEHKLYKDTIKQTVLSRCKIEETAQLELAKAAT